MPSPKVCTRCVMDTTAAGIVFDDEGVCSFCRAFERRLDDARRQAADHLAHRRAAIGRADAEAVLAEILGQQVADVAVIVHHQDVRGRVHRRGPGLGSLVDSAGRRAPAAENCINLSRPRGKPPARYKSNGGLTKFRDNPPPYQGRQRHPTSRGRT